eukprot:TRINITY_DN30070_c0_g1_i1.p1 TRINITY_DN30070_c0_g1~~TRINITY_DN30070_c0_g1_i1.p1  ORF type:complete len:416 (+),score=65.11 TRINITY_DN30070_c0_g1_i1:96-1250(+)
MEGLAKVEGDWWKPKPDMAELEVTILKDPSGGEMVVSGGLIAEMGEIVKKTEKTVYYKALPVVNARGCVGERKPCVVGVTTDKRDAIENAPAPSVWVLDEGEGDETLGKATHRVKIDRGSYRPVSGVHGPSDTVVVTDVGSQLSGVICPIPTPSRDVFRIGTCGDYPPLSIWSEENGFTGFSVEFLEEGLKGRVEWVKTSWPELHKGLLEGRYDAAFGGINETGERRRMFLVSDAVLPCGKCVLTREEEAARFKNFSSVDQEGVVVVTNPGGTNEKFCNLNFKKAAILRAPDNKAPFTDLTSRRAHVMITDSIEAIHRSHTTPTLTYLHTNPPLTPGHTVAIAAHTPAGAAFIQAFNAYVNHPSTAAVFERLTTKWLGSPLSRL